MKRSTHELLDWLLSEALERRRRMERDGEEHELAAEYIGTLPPQVDSSQMAKALEELRDIEPEL